MSTSNVTETRNSAPLPPEKGKIVALLTAIHEEDGFESWPRRGTTTGEIIVRSSLRSRQLFPARSPSLSRLDSVRFIDIFSQSFHRLYFSTTTSTTPPLLSIISRVRLVSVLPDFARSDRQPLRDRRENVSCCFISNEKKEKRISEQLYAYTCE